MPAQIVLHVGAPKTGSSAIQKAIKENASFFERAGVDTFPSLLRGSGNSILPELFLNRQSCAARVEKANAILNTTKSSVGLISSEAFWSRNPEKVIECFPALKNARVVMYIRDQNDLILSHYRQKLKNPNFSMSPRVFFKSHWHEYDFFLQAQRWNSAGGGDATLRVYTSSTDIVSDFFRDFLFQKFRNLFDCETATFAIPEGRLNPSQAAFEAYYRLFVNGDHQQLLAELPAGMRRARDGLEEPQFRFSADLRAEISEKYAVSNQRVLDTFFADQKREHLFEV